MLREGTDALAFENRIRDFMDLHREGQNENFIIKLGLQPFSEMYLHSSMKDGEIVGGRIQYVNLFMIVAVFILLIACINFMNLTTARSMKRAREIGVRKVAGAVRGALIRQFLGEALFIVTIGLMIGIVIVALVLPAFNSITQKQMAIPFDQVAFWIGVLSVTFITGLISGTYPAIFLSSFTPVRAFKGTLKFGSKALWFRKGLVVLQFTLSVILIIGTIVISRQIKYIQTANLGYDRENLIYIPLEGDLPPKYELFKNRALDGPGIQAVSRITQNPTSIENGTGGVWWEGKDPNAVLQFVQVGVGYDFIKTMNIELRDGRDFSRDLASDSAAYIVNEAAVRIFGYKDPVGMPLTFWQRPGKIIGVTKDFHFNSLHHDIKPLIIRLGENRNGWVLVRIQAARTKDALSSLQAVCTELNPKFPFTYKFSDDEYHEMYASEQVVSKLSDMFAVLAIFISCLGLLGLAMFTVEQRTKEIGIRKVLGASIFSLFNLLSKDLMLLVVIALFIAAPLAWIAMDSWLSEYAYRVDLAWWIFVLAGVVAMLIALMTISFQTLKALLSNPVTSLRSD